MKRLQKSHGVGVALAALAFAGLSLTAKAIPLAGNYQGPITIHLSSLDNGAVYQVIDINPDPDVTTYGLSNGSGTAVGYTNVDNLIQAIPANRQATGSGNGNGFEDGFGIVVVDQILGSGGQVLYDKANGGFTLAGLIYGIQDYAVSIDPFSGQQYLSSTGMKVDLYNLPFDPTVLADGNPSDHTALAVFNGITNIGPSPALQLVAQAGLFSPSLTNPGGLTTSLLTDFNATSNTGHGAAFLNVVGGTDAAQFNLNTENGGTDMALQYTLSQGFAQYHAPWLVADSDPISGSYIPEPTSALSGLACMAPILGMVLGRRRKTTLV
jgi:hypothetical protein